MLHVGLEAVGAKRRLFLRFGFNRRLSIPCGINNRLTIPRGITDHLYIPTVSLFPHIQRSPYSYKGLPNNGLHIRTTVSLTTVSLFPHVPLTASLFTHISLTVSIHPSISYRLFIPTHAFLFPGRRRPYLQRSGALRPTGGGKTPGRIKTPSWLFVLPPFNSLW